jgi:hypothetical protein
MIIAADKYSMNPNPHPGSLPSRRTKVALSQDGLCAFGYAGAATINGIDTLTTLAELVNGHSGEPLSKIASTIGSELHFSQEQEFPGNANSIPEQRGILVHLLGYNNCVPEVWFVRNIWTLLPSGQYSDIWKKVKCSNELTDNRKEPYSIYRQANCCNPIGFQQGVSLDEFLRVQERVRQSTFRVPNSLSKWEAYVKRLVVAFGYHFSNLPFPDNYVVGGGVDSVTLPIPGGYTSISMPRSVKLVSRSTGQHTLF